MDTNKDKERKLRKLRKLQLYDQDPELANYEELEEINENLEAIRALDLDKFEVITIKGDDGRDGVDGKDGRDGKDGKDGRDGLDGEDGLDGLDADPDKIIEEVLNRIPAPKDGKDGNQITTEEIADKLNDQEEVLNLETIKGYKNLLKGKSGGFFGGAGGRVFRLEHGGWGPQETIVVAVSDETTTITTGNAKVTFHLPYNFNLIKVKAGLTTASSSGNPAFDLNDDGTSVFSTTVTIDANEKFSDTAATPSVLTSYPVKIASGSLMTIDIDTAGTGAKGAKLYLIGYPTGDA